MLMVNEKTCSTHLLYGENLQSLIMIDFNRLVESSVKHILFSKLLWSHYFQNVHYSKDAIAFYYN